MVGQVVVIGSINVDLVVEVERLPAPGETVAGRRFSEHQGGKGANQAVAAARAGARVRLIGAVGDDERGRAALEALEEEGVDVGAVRRVAAPTGVALVVVGPRGENQIAVAAGANEELTPEDVVTSGSSGVVLATFESPMPAVLAAVAAARNQGATAIVDPAPAHALPQALLELGPILTPNEHELTVAIGNEDSAAALDELAARNGGPIIVTQGAAGALLAAGDRRDRFDGFRIPQVVDTTGAGDAFNGALAAFLAEGRPLPSAVRLANAAAALSIGQRGAREGMPRRSAILELAGEGR
jgi:ribokinase